MAWPSPMRLLADQGNCTMNLWWHELPVIVLTDFLNFRLSWPYSACMLSVFYLKVYMEVRTFVKPIWLSWIQYSLTYFDTSHPSKIKKLDQAADGAVQLIIIQHVTIVLVAGAAIRTARGPHQNAQDFLIMWVLLVQSRVWRNCIANDYPPTHAAHYVNSTWT